MSLTYARMPHHANGGPMTMYVVQLMSAVMSRWKTVFESGRTKIQSSGAKMKRSYATLTQSSARQK